MSEKIPGDRLVLAVISVLRTLILELDKRNVLDADEFVNIVQETAATHRQSGDPHNIASAIDALSEHLLQSNTG